MTPNAGTDDTRGLTPFACDFVSTVGAADPVATGSDDRIDRDHYEPSPSAGWRETARVLDATGGADHAPECDASGCSRGAELVTIVDAATGDARRTARCGDHTKPVLEVST